RRGPGRTRRPAHHDAGTPQRRRTGSRLAAASRTAGGTGSGLPAPGAGAGRRVRGGTGMSWMTWRQHRAETAVALLLVACLGVALYLTGLPAHTSFAQDGVGACLTQRTATCAAVIERFRTTFGGVQTLLLTLNLVPVLIGAFLGAPLVAREFEAGTWQLAWT